MSAQPLVYVADDESDLTALLAEALGDAGFRVRTSSNGRELLDEVARERPDLILLDINMPGMSGWEVRRELMDNPESADVPVIAVTAQGGATTEASALRTLGFDDFVRKPFRLADVLSRVEGALAKKTA